MSGSGPQVGWGDVPVLTVETEGADSLAASVREGRLVTLPAITSIATSLGARTVAAEAYEQAKADTSHQCVVSDADAISACLKFAGERPSDASTISWCDPPRACLTAIPLRIAHPHGLDPVMIQILLHSCLLYNLQSSLIPPVSSSPPSPPPPPLLLTHLPLLPHLSLIEEHHRTLVEPACKYYDNNPTSCLALTAESLHGQALTLAILFTVFSGGAALAGVYGGRDLLAKTGLPLPAAGDGPILAVVCGGGGVTLDLLAGWKSRFSL